MVLVATCVDNPHVHPIGLIDMTVNRNAFGRQRESFEADLVMDSITGGPFHAIFIRAPVGTDVGKGVNVLARIDRGIVAVEYGKHMALAFHPELGSDTRLHEAVFKEERNLMCKMMQLKKSSSDIQRRKYERGCGE